ncbi:MmcQ/YjbR family DNA-binding protein [Nocardiopsis lambiniae]|uniref:MmcQ/YjbR family DNA-binding protein n=1 Tax=Nocardiopsis lambiniae TaxID=3075539 RepID=A0ABU2MG38_9ACTN|nr:MmcQ/YjbR family DNA-binding protein [Nocardiopsis sp. DSM 44743]MDT0331667.1 MmcQ/YjbR family DNA-binding protein [Nocardiopsis sp. DSM 44743]
MKPSRFIEAALWFPEAVETEPFGPGPLVYKVCDRMFALFMEGSDGDAPARANLKCDPVHALELRDRFPAVTPGYHMNKDHWNTVVLDGTVPEDEVLEMLRDSYTLVARGLRKADRERVLAVLGDDLPEIGDA